MLDTFMVKLLIIFRIYLDGFFDDVVDVPLEDIFNLSAAATAVAKFWECCHVEIDACIYSSRKGSAELHWVAQWSSAFLLNQKVPDLNSTDVLDRALETNMPLGSS